MFEVIKLLVEQIFKLIDLKQISTWTRGRKKSEIGESLFSLYSELNDIYINGILMTREIDSVARIGRQYSSEGRNAEMILDRGLGRTVAAQQLALYRFAASFQELVHIIDLVDPETTRRLTIFLSTKMNVLNLLNGIFGHRKDLLLSARAENNLLAVIEDFFVNQSDANERFSSTQSKLLQAVENAGPEIDVARITVEQSLQFERYNELRKPQDQLQELKVILEGFRAELIKHFDISDILLRVGGRHRERTEPEMVYWEPKL